MRIINKRGNTTTIRTLTNQDKSIVYGIIGRVGDLIDQKILTYCDYEPNTWCFLPHHGKSAYFAKSKMELLNNITEIE